MFKEQKKNEVIFSATTKSAEFKMEEIVKDIKTNSYEFIIKRIGNQRVVTNLRTITAVRASDSARGVKCHYAYVDADVSIRLLHLVVYPCLSPVYYYNLNPKDCIELFNM